MEHILRRLCLGTNAASVNAYGSMLVAIAIMLIPAAVFLAVTCWILEHKLNLE